MSSSKRIIKNTLYLYIKTGLTSFIVLYTTRLILQSLGETDFGIYNIVGGVISMLGFLNASMAVAVQRFLNFEQGRNNFENLEKIFHIGLVFHIAIAVCITFVLLILGIFLFDGILNIPSERLDAAKIIYGCLIFSTFITIITVPYDACLNAHENMLYFSIVGIIEAILKLIVALWVVNSSMDRLILYGVLMTIIPLVSFSLMRIYCHKHYKECSIPRKISLDKNIVKEMISFIGWNLLGTMSSYVGNYGNMIVMNHFFGAILNTVMGIANQIQGQLMVFSTGMLKALNPVIAKEAGARNTQNMMIYTFEGCRLSTLLLAFLAIPIFVEAPYVLDFWIGDYPKWTILFVRLQILRALLEQVSISLTKSLESEGNIKTYSIFMAFFNLLPIPILSLLYHFNYQPYWHYIVAITCMVIFPLILKIILCKKYCNLRIMDFFYKVFFPVAIIIFILIVAGFVLSIFIDEGTKRFFINLVVLEVIFMLSVFLSLNQYEIQAIKNLSIYKYKKFNSKK